MTQDRIALFETESIPKAVLKLSIPTVLSSLVMIIYSLADTFYVGMMNDSVQNAAVTLAAPVLLAFNAVNNLFGVGSSSMISRALGRKDYKTAYQSSAFGIYCSLFFGLLFGALSLIFNKELLTLIGATDVTWAATEAYMRWTVVLGACPAILNVVLAYLVRAEGSSLNASIGTMSGCVLNIILDPFFVLPQFLGMGAEGAALATLLSNTFSVLYFAVFILVKRGNTYVTINPKYFVLKKAIILGVFAVGIPAAIQNLLNVTGMTLLNNITSTYGADAVASMGIAQRLNHVPINIAMGFTHGIMPLVGYCFAAGNYSRMKNTVKCTAKVCASCLVCASLIYYLAAPFLVFNVHEEARDRILWNIIFERILSRTSFCIFGLCCSWCIPGNRKGLVFTFVCSSEKDCIRDSCNLDSQSFLPSIWFGIFTVCCRDLDEYYRSCVLDKDLCAFGKARQEDSIIL